MTPYFEGPGVMLVLPERETAVGRPQAALRAVLALQARVERLRRAETPAAEARHPLAACRTLPVPRTGCNAPHSAVKPVTVLTASSSVLERATMTDAARAGVLWPHHRGQGRMPAHQRIGILVGGEEVPATVCAPSRSPNPKR